ncbi:transcriptional regulator [Actinocatenispora thailandica]|uniref:Transcriptional regulator n=1 Tax=Actinocatenispora thailandica TaxID=227318 RepID=A0A7R7DQC7_9ACTN|nr:helix-turn-helix domain-containing protein [Actinocatenispora thailandica]BCJ35746.1 transcriptional regulator [Actinocatenispora thailandica]
MSTEPVGSATATGDAPARPVGAGDVDVAAVARLIGEPARAAMLDALLAGRALAAGELARIAGVSPGTASEHLARLRDGGLVEVVAAGRHRYHRLASPEVGQVLEALALVGQPKPVRTLRQSRANAALLVARTCYDHLAGQVGVAVHDALVSREALRTVPNGYQLTPAGGQLLTGLGVDVAAARSARRAFARPCLDFTERRSHLAGALGAALCAHFLSHGLLVLRASGHRGLRVTDGGRRMLADTFGITETQYPGDPS